MVGDWFVSLLWVDTVGSWPGCSLWQSSRVRTHGCPNACDWYGASSSARSLQHSPAVSFPSLGENSCVLALSSQFPHPGCSLTNLNWTWSREAGNIKVRTPKYFVKRVHSSRSDIYLVPLLWEKLQHELSIYLTAVNPHWREVLPVPWLWEKYQLEPWI